MAENPQLSYAQYTGEPAINPAEQSADVQYTAQPQYAAAEPIIDAHYAEPARPMYQEIGQQGVQPLSAHEQYVDQALSADIVEGRQPRIEAAMQLVNQANEPAAPPLQRVQEDYRLAA